MPDPTTIGQRFTQLIQQLGLSKNAFAQSLDRTATVIQHLVDERNKPGYDLLCRVFEVYPNVSKDWLLLGRGPMLLEAVAPGIFKDSNAAATTAEAIDLTTIAGSPRRRVTAALQPAEIAAAVALAATQAAQAPSAEQPAQPTAAVPNPVHTVASAPPQPAALAAPVLLAPSSLPPVPVAPDPAYLAALLQAQHVQHQLALAEQRNQHLLEQQQLLQQMVQLLQRSA